MDVLLNIHWYPNGSTLRCGFPSSAGLGIHVLMDLVHAHASSNTLDGIAQMDGTDHCCAPENRWKAVSSWSGVVVSTRCHGAGWVELQPDISNDFVWFLRQGSWYYIINVNPGLINHGLLTRGYSSNSHFRWYLNGTLPFFNNRLGFINPGLTFHIGFVVNDLFLVFFSSKSWSTSDGEALQPVEALAKLRGMMFV